MDIPAAVYGRKRLMAPGCLYPGDLLLSRVIYNSIHHRQIEKAQCKFCGAQHARWVHATLIRQDYKFMEMTTGGIKKGYVWAYNGDEYYLKVRRVPDRRITQRREIVDFAWERTDGLKGYDWWSIARLKLQRSPDGLYGSSAFLFKRSICSAFYVKAVQGIGVDLGKGKDPRFVTPGHLSATELMEDIEIQWITGEELEGHFPATGGR